MKRAEAEHDSDLERRAVHALLRHLVDVRDVAAHANVLELVCRLEMMQVVKRLLQVTVQARLLLCDT